MRPRFASSALSSVAPSFVAAIGIGACSPGSQPAELEGPTSRAARSVFVLHSPIQPTSGQVVRYSATATAADGVASIEIWERRTTLSACPSSGGSVVLRCATPVDPTDPQKLLHTCHYSNPASPRTCTYSSSAPYPDGSFIGYKAIARDEEGNESSDGWIYFAAGAFPWPRQPVPIYVTREPSEAIDLVFIPDTGYVSGEFRSHTEAILTEAYLGPDSHAEDVRNWRGLWNFYLTDEPGEKGISTLGCIREPGNWLDLRATVDAGALLHRAATEDCYRRDVPLFTVGATKDDAFTLAVHELGHAAFRLADEYCCNGGYWEEEEEPNVMKGEANCQSNATGHGWPPADCTSIHADWWHSDGPGDVMDDGSVTPGFGRSGKGRLLWRYERCLAGEC